MQKGDSGFGARIRAARKKQGWTQEQLANRIGIKRATVSKYESGDIEPSIEMVDSIAKWLGVDFYDLIGKRNAKWYDSGIKAGSEAEEWLNNSIYELEKADGYSFSEIEAELVKAFSALTPDGQRKAVERVQELAEIPKYQRPASPPPQPQGNEIPFWEK